MGFPLLDRNCGVNFPWKIICAITNEIKHVEKSFKMVTKNTICTEHIQHSNHDIIIVEVTMARGNFQKLLNPEINKNSEIW